MNPLREIQKKIQDLTDEIESREQDIKEFQMINQSLKKQRAELRKTLQREYTEMTTPTATNPNASENSWAIALLGYHYGDLPLRK